MQTEVQKFETFIADIKATPTHSLVQQMETTISLIRLETELNRAKKEELKNRKEVLLKLGIRCDSISTDK